MKKLNNGNLLTFFLSFWSTISSKRRWLFSLVRRNQRAKIRPRWGQKLNPLGLMWFRVIWGLKWSGSEVIWGLGWSWVWSTLSLYRWTPDGFWTFKFFLLDHCWCLSLLVLSANHFLIISPFLLNKRQNMMFLHRNEFSVKQKFNWHTLIKQVLNVLFF